MKKKYPSAYKLICKMQVPRILCKIIYGQNTSMIHITVTQYQSDTMDFSLLDLYAIQHTDHDNATVTH